MNAEFVKYIKTMLLRFQAMRGVHVMFSVLKGQGVLLFWVLLYLMKLILSDFYASEVRSL